MTLLLYKLHLVLSHLRLFFRVIRTGNFLQVNKKENNFVKNNTNDKFVHPSKETLRDMYCFRE